MSFANPQSMSFALQFPFMLMFLDECHGDTSCTQPLHLAFTEPRMQKVWLWRLTAMVAVEMIGKTRIVSLTLR